MAAQAEAGAARDKVLESGGTVIFVPRDFGIETAKGGFVLHSYREYYKSFIEADIELPPAVFVMTGVVAIRDAALVRMHAGGLGSSRGRWAVDTGCRDGRMAPCGRHLCCRQYPHTQQPPMNSNTYAMKRPPS